MGSKRKRQVKDSGSEQPQQKKPSLQTTSDSPHAALFLDKTPFRKDLEKDDPQRRREAQLYRLLGSEDVAARLGAAQTIASALIGEHGVPTTVLKRHLHKLFRGLASGSAAARPGFGIAAVEVIRQLFGKEALAATRYPDLKFADVLDMLVEKTSPSNSMSGQETRDHFWGQLFGLKGFVQAGVVFGDSARWYMVLDGLLSLAKKKSWLRSQSAFVIAQAIQTIDDEHKDEIRPTLEKVSEAGIAKTVDGLGIWLAALKRRPKKKLPEPWKKPFSSKSLQAVAAVFGSSGKESDEDDTKSHTQHGNATTQVHFVWDLIITHFLALAPDETGDFKLFWERVVDQVYFRKGASDSQKLTGFKLFQNALHQGAAAGLVWPGLFSKNLMTCLMNQASSVGPRLHRAAVQCLKAIEREVETTPDILVSVLRGLLGENGAFNFDERIKGTGDGTKTVDKILRSTNASNARDVVAALRETALEANRLAEDQKPLRILGEYLSKLVIRSQDAIIGTGESRGENYPVSICGLAFEELVEVTYAKPTSRYPTPNKMTQDTCRQRVSSAAASLLNKPDLYLCLCKSILDIDTVAIAMSEEIRAAAKAARGRLQRIMDSVGNQRGSEIERALGVLHVVLLLQLFNDPSPDIFQLLSDSQNYLEEREKNQAEGSAASERLVEILLSMLAASSRLTRQASLLIFEAFTDVMSEPALDYLTEILAAEENSQGYKDLFSNEAEDEDEDEDMEDVEELEPGADFSSDDEVDEDDEGNEDDESGSSSSEIGNGSDDESDVGDVENTAENIRDDGTFEAALMSAFKVSHTLAKDHEAESSDDDADMSDSEMLALDDQLEGHMKLLKAKRSNKKSREDARKKVVEFKHRVLDLLEVYVKVQGAVANKLVFGLVPPLLSLMRLTKDKSVFGKANKVIAETKKALKKGRSVVMKMIDADVDSIILTMEAIHGLANDPTENKAFAAAVSSASLAVASCLFAMDKENYHRIAGVYRQTQDRVVLEGFNVRADLFLDWGNWCRTVSTANGTRDEVGEA